LGEVAVLMLSRATFRSSAWLLAELAEPLSCVLDVRGAAGVAHTRSPNYDREHERPQAIRSPPAERVSNPSAMALSVDIAMPQPSALEPARTRSTR
jgi:hypothetical protein